jgi:serine/threonine-protein kinase
MLQPNQVLRQRYQIRALIGQGGFGAVYQAVDLNLARDCAVKENLDASVPAQQQFQREAQMLTRVRHPNLPQIWDYFIEPSGQQYLVMEFVAGTDLQTLVQTRGALPEAHALAWINQILDALDYLHAQNPPIIHRDIKPANIIINAQGRAMLVDFGIAKMYIPGRITTTGARGVTPGFSPPEQYGGGTDPRSDLYALGATLYAVLTRAMPPESPMLAVGHATLIAPRQLAPQISLNTEAVILRAMQAHPTNRFQSAREMKMALATTTAYASPRVTATAYAAAPARASPWQFAAIGGGIASVLMCLALIVALLVFQSPIFPTPTVSPSARGGGGSAPVAITPTLTRVLPDMPTRTRTTTETPTRTPIVTPAPAYFFTDEFDGSSVDLSRWNADARGGRFVVSRGALSMSSGGTSYPFITSRGNPFPPSGNYRLTTRYRYTSLNTCGVGLMMTSYNLSAGLSQDRAAQTQRANEDNGMSAGMWQDVKDPLHLLFRSRDDRVDVPSSGFDTDWRTQVVEYVNDRYTLLLDGVVKYVSQTTPHRARFIWIGNPVELGRGFDCPWDSLEVDFIRVQSLP